MLIRFIHHSLEISSFLALASQAPIIKDGANPLNLQTVISVKDSDSAEGDPDAQASTTSATPAGDDPSKHGTSSGPATGDGGAVASAPASSDGRSHQAEKKETAAKSKAKKEENMPMPSSAAESKNRKNTLIVSCHRLSLSTTCTA